MPTEQLMRASWLGSDSTRQEHNLQAFPPVSARPQTHTQSRTGCFHDEHPQKNSFYPESLPESTTAPVTHGVCMTNGHKNKTYREYLPDCEYPMVSV